VTPEPGAKQRRTETGRSFVVQKHAATRLHYDFRLEHNGVLLSWAVPKGPSLDPTEKSLAVQVEDHPVDYGSFEGTIPQGQYGGGTVLLWDRGTWEPRGDVDEGLRSGKLKFVLHGEKLRGGWTLVRMRGKEEDDGKNWLLIKERDEEARPHSEGDVREERPESVATARSLEEIAAANDRVWESKPRKATARSRIARKAAAVKAREGSKPAGRLKAADLPGAVKAAFPELPTPQLATLVKEAPAGDEWVHEVKYDGYRIMALCQKGRVRLITRRGNDWTDRFKTVAAGVHELEVESAVLDGEVVVLDERGRSSFQALQNVLKGVKKSTRLLYFVFDLVYLDGYDLSRSPLLERKRLLAQVLERAAGTPLRYSEHIQGHGEQVMSQACDSSLEGIISKRANSLYTPRRTKAWLKVKCGNRQEFVIGGYTDPSGSREHFGALLLGTFDAKGEFIYCGRVGTGFDSRLLASLKKRMRAYEADGPAFKNPPRGAEARGVHWLKPVLVCEVQFSEWTDEGILRHPSFQGLREDKEAREVVREDAKIVLDDDKSDRVARASQRPKPDDGTVAGVKLTNPQRVQYPELGITKLELARYYEAVAEWVLPHLVHRPLSLVRCPQGREKHCFYQKHLTDTLPASVHGVPIREKKGVEEYVAIENLTGLVGLVQLGVLEFHPWGCREDDVEHPDRLIIDLDPGPGVEWGGVVEGARLVRERLEDLGLESFVKTTGGKGLHVVLPIQRRTEWEEAKAFAKAIADGIVRDHPGEYLAVMTKAKRQGRIFVDYLRNGRGATAIAPYSTRAREGAPVAVPLSWEELDERLLPRMFDVRTVPARLAKLKRDPWERMGKVRQSLTAAVLRRVGLR